MKIVFLILIVLSSIFANAQIGTPIFNIKNNGSVISNNLFIDTLSSKWLDYLNKYKVTLNTPIQINVASSTYTIKTGTYIYENRDDEPGEFDVIEISKNGKQILLLKELEGIIKFRNTKYSPDKYHSINQFSKCKYIDNDYFISIPLSTSSKALIFRGMPYGAGVPRLIIIVLTESDAKLVYYKYMDINDIILTANEFSMITMSSYAEWISEEVLGSPDITHTIWIENEVLKFKNN